MNFTVIGVYNNKTILICLLYLLSMLLTDRKYLNFLMKNSSFKNMEDINKDSKKVGVLVTDKQYLKNRLEDITNLTHSNFVDFFRKLSDKTANGVKERVNDSLSFLERRSLFWEQSAKAKPK